MAVQFERKDIVVSLEKIIKDGKRVLIVDSDDAELVELLCKKISDGNLTGVEIWHSSGEVVDSDGLRSVSSQDMRELVRLYYMYDFSHRVALVSDSSRYGTLYNYVKTGIMTKEEMADALLYLK